MYYHILSGNHFIPVVTAESMDFLAAALCVGEINHEGHVSSSCGCPQVAIWVTLVWGSSLSASYFILESCSCGCSVISSAAPVISWQNGITPSIFTHFNLLRNDQDHQVKLRPKNLMVCFSLNCKNIRLKVIYPNNKVKWNGTEMILFQDGVNLMTILGVFKLDWNWQP